LGNCEKTAIFAQLTKFLTKMATTADIKIGMCIELNGKTFQIVDFQHVKPGKGPAFVRTKLKNLENGRTVDNTFTAGVAIEPVRVERRPYQFLYEDDMGCNFMHTETFEQIVIDRKLIDNSDLMKEGQIVEVMFHTDKEMVLSAELPPIIDMEVVYTEPGVKGDTASTNSLKPATVETGATIKVPLFIQTGEKIRVDTRTREYYERIK
jgi:elongation factor P